MWWRVLIAALIGITATWAGLLTLIVIRRPPGQSLADLLRLLPDVLRLITRLAKDPTLPTGVRWRLALLVGYLASPIDLIPDFLPFIGYADDAIIVALVLRGVARRAGPEANSRHWLGRPEGLATVLTACGCRQRPWVAEAPDRDEPKPPYPCRTCGSNRLGGSPAIA